MPSRRGLLVLVCLLLLSRVNWGFYCCVWDHSDKVVLRWDQPNGAINSNVVWQNVKLSGCDGDGIWYG